MNNQEKGLLYERFVKDFIIQKIGKNAFLWNECPENILIEKALIHSHNDMRLIRKDIKEGYLHCHKDIGIDVIQINGDNCSIVQCKNGYANGLCVEDISGIMMRSNFLKNVPTFIYYTNCLSRNIRYTAKLSSYVVNIDCSTNIDKLLEVSDDNKIYFVKLPYEDNNNIEEFTKTEIIPYSYQNEAVDKFKEHFQSNNRGILSLPCGCGKTYTSYMISSEYSHIVILSPLREFASQNLYRFIEYGYDKNNTLLVDTDGNRDIESIKYIIKNKNKLLISCTYNSMDLISECLDLFQDALFIVDEFHNLSKANISDDDNHIFKLLMSDHKILFMSATPRVYDIEYDDEAFDMEWLFGDVVYQMTFTDAIANKYITDYKIWLPSIHENNEELNKELSIYEIDNEIKNRCKFLYSCIANNGSRKCIVYCKDTEDMKSIMECMKTLNEFYIMDIDVNSISCEDSEKKRKHTLECFAKNNDKIQLLFNIRILNECIDIPSCDSIYISYAPKNKITTIQRISRSTRTDKNNPYKIANVYIWCEEYEEILETLSSIKEYDIMFKDKIKVNAVDFYHSKEDKEIELVENDKVLLSNCIVGVKEFRVMSWEEKLEMVEEYIKDNGKLPSQADRNRHIKQLAAFWSKQKIHYMNNTLSEKHNILWELFINKHTNLSSLFKTYEENFMLKLDELKRYISENQCLPSSSSEDETFRKLRTWLTNKMTDYKKRKDIMSRSEIRLQWKDFIQMYSEYFISNEEIWRTKLNEVNEYIKKYNRIPSAVDKIDSKLGNWLSKQRAYYKQNNYIMKNPIIRKEWEDFIKTNEGILRSSISEDRKALWIYNLNKVKEYINIYNKLPSSVDEKKDVKKLGNWINTQKQNYKTQEQVMKDPMIRQEWEQFILQYSIHFMSNEDLWMYNLNKVKEYVSKYNILPLSNDKIEEIKRLGIWLSSQRQNYKNNIKIIKNPIIRQEWEDFIKKTEGISPSFIKGNNIRQWTSRFDELKEYLNKHNKMPTQADTDETTKFLARWVNTQKVNYKKQVDIMKEDVIRCHWEDFMNEYPIFFLTNAEMWMFNLNKVKEYIIKNNKLPSSHSNVDEETKKLGTWLYVHKHNYISGEQIMGEEVIRKEWEQFMNDFSSYFQSNEEVWNNNLQNVKHYVSQYHKLPIKDKENPYINNLALWITNQKTDYKNKTHKMKNPLIKQLWEEFMSENPSLFITYKEKWVNKLQDVIKYVEEYNRLPAEKSKNTEIKCLGNWVSTQKANYKNTSGSMKDPLIRQQWEDFTAKYPHLF